ncbi:MAG: gliding motility-associated C-terminal domain-containing protein [Flavobacteriales bacterium]|nr:gliding motility-associated C-terminal domain-containing protein [Flavobacteriales bacterium]
MKKDLNHIDEIFKNSLENFEANVDPSVWANVSQSIGNTAGATSAGGAAASGVSKSILFYAAASIIATVTVVGSVYLFNNDKTEQKPIDQTTVTIPIIEESAETQVVIEDKEKNVVVEESSSVLATEESLEPLTESNQLVNKEEVETRTTTEETLKTVSQTENEIVENKNSAETKTTTEKQETKETQTQTTNQKTEVKEFNISIRSNVKKGKAPLDVEFGVSGEGVSYLWDFGDNTTTSSEETPYHTFKKPGTYKVTLTAIDEDANAKVSFQIIEVEKNKVSKIDEIQNVFSPNGDGINDIIKIEGENISKFHAAVMDSKGNLIYEWESIDGFWDGKDNNNNILPKGTYYLVVTAKGEDGEQHIAKKSIQLY